jgi:hypothetical protein
MRRRTDRLATYRESIPNYDQQAKAGMHWIDEVVFTVNFVNVNVVTVSPVRRPRIVVHPVVAAVVEATIFASAHAEVVFASEVRVEVLLADAPSVAISAVTLRLLRVGVILASNLLVLLLVRDSLLLRRLLLMLLLLLLLFLTLFRRLLLLFRRV